jgi:hypothetical protein
LMQDLPGQAAEAVGHPQIALLWPNRGTSLR